MLEAATLFRRVPGACRHSPVSGSVQPLGSRSALSAPSVPSFFVLRGPAAASPPSSPRPVAPSCAHCCLTRRSEACRSPRGIRVYARSFEQSGALYHRIEQIHLLRRRIIWSRSKHSEPRPVILHPRFKYSIVDDGNFAKLHLIFFDLKSFYKFL